ncbi:hypothetical protein [Pseudorhodobacter sp.]|uniref:hypothetical protein n=1 Tax=Pseudorhodobacter sp. TaxID=1934400 RepID=UPI002648C77F|nr:hypothetical protein [Pseudorhodobacter sp.]MDN5787519.1 hypothetical protein [Pseudorhodobacter sp.]
MKAEHHHAPYMAIIGRVFNLIFANCDFSARKRRFLGHFGHAAPMFHPATSG